MWNKLVKLYPLYFVTTVFAVSYSGIPNCIANSDFETLDKSLEQLVKNLLLIQSWYSEHYFSYNGVGWFLSSIMFLYMLRIPLMACMTMLRKKAKYGYIVPYIIFMLAIIAIVIYCYMMRGAKLEYWLYVFPLSRIGEYVCGICLGYIICSVRDKVTYSFRTRIFFLIFETLSLIIWIIALYSPVFKPWHATIVSWLFPNVLLLTVFTFGKGIVSDLFKFKIFKYLGDISFICFLIHQVIIQQYSVNSGISVTSRHGGAFSILFCLSITVILAMLIKSPQMRKKD